MRLPSLTPDSGFRGGGSLLRTWVVMGCLVWMMALAMGASEPGVALDATGEGNGSAAIPVASTEATPELTRVTDRNRASTLEDGAGGSVLRTGYGTGTGTGLVLGMEPKPLPDMGGSVVRMVGGLAMVLALFFGGIWVVRNGRRLGVVRGKLPDLRLLECRSLGGRQSVWVMSYQRQRFLVASGPTGVTLLSVLPEAEEVREAEVESGVGVVSVPAVGGTGSGRKLVMADFMGALRQALGRSAGGGR